MGRERNSQEFLSQMRSYLDDIKAHILWLTYFELSTHNNLSLSAVSEKNVTMFTQIRLIKYSENGLYK